MINKKQDTEIRKLTLSNKHNMTDNTALYLFLNRRALKTRKDKNMIPYSRIFRMLSNLSLAKSF